MIQMEQVVVILNKNLFNFKVILINKPKERAIADHLSDILYCNIFSILITFTLIN